MSPLRRARRPRPGPIRSASILLEASPAPRPDAGDGPAASDSLWWGSSTARDRPGAGDAVRDASRRERITHAPGHVSPRPTRARVHLDRTPGRDFHHRGPDCPAAARRPGRARGRPPAQCASNQKQIGMALHNYHTTSNTFPPFSVTLRDRAAPPWSALVRLLPYIEPSDLASGVDLDATSGAWSHATLAQTRVAAYLCPSEVYDRRRPTATMTSYPSNHAFNCGTWLVSDPAGGPVGDGAFVPDRAMRQGDFHRRPGPDDGIGRDQGVSALLLARDNVGPPQGDRPHPCRPPSKSICRRGRSTAPAIPSG